MWFVKAAQQGKPKAVYKVGVMCLRGMGVNPNLIEGVRWLQRAVEMGHAKAKSRLEEIQPERLAHYWPKTHGILFPELKCQIEQFQFFYMNQSLPIEILTRIVQFIIKLHYYFVK